MEAVRLSPAELAMARPVAVRAVDLRFDPATITATPGDILRIQLTNGDALLHDWNVPGVPGAHVDADGFKTAEAVFRAPARGTYQIVCTVPGHKDAGMVGTLIVQ